MPFLPIVSRVLLLVPLIAVIVNGRRATPLHGTVPIWIGWQLMTLRSRGPESRKMPKLLHACVIGLVICRACAAAAADQLSWPSTLPVYDLIVIVVEENKDYEQILGDKFDAPYIRRLAAEGAVFERMFAEEHFSQGNYFWLFSGSNQNVGFLDQVPSKATHPNYPFQASNLGEQLIGKGFSFKGCSESLPNIGSTADL